MDESVASSEDVAREAINLLRILQYRRDKLTRTECNYAGYLANVLIARGYTPGWEPPCPKSPWAPPPPREDARTDEEVLRKWGL